MRAEDIVRQELGRGMLRAAFPVRSVLRIPIKIESTPNQRVHWRVRATTNATHRAAAYFACKQAKVKRVFPCVVTLRRIAPRELDDDNLVGGFKSTRDGIADWLGEARIKRRPE